MAELTKFLLKKDLLMSRLNQYDDNNAVNAVSGMEVELQWHYERVSDYSE